VNDFTLYGFIEAFKVRNVEGANRLDGCCERLISRLGRSQPFSGGA
jgi:hypothetical protein